MTQVAIQEEAKKEVTFLGTVVFPSPRDGKEHSIAVYTTKTAVPSERLHPNWPEEFRGVLRHPFDKDELTQKNEIMIFKYGEQMSKGIAGIIIHKHGDSYTLEENPDQ